LLKEEFEQREITIEILSYIFPLYFAPPSPAPPVLTQGPPSPPVSGTPQPPDGLVSSKSRDGIPLANESGEVHMVVDLPDTTQLVKLSSNDKLM